MPCPATIAGWLISDGFDVADDVSLVFGPYRARPGREPDGPARARSVVRLALHGCREGSHRHCRRPGTFFTDANGWSDPGRPGSACPSDRSATRRISSWRGHAGCRLREVFRPDAVVIHSHHYATIDRIPSLVRRMARTAGGAGHPAAPALSTDCLGVQRAVRDDLALARAEGRLAGAGWSPPLPLWAITPCARRAPCWAPRRSPCRRSAGGRVRWRGGPTSIR